LSLTLASGKAAARKKRKKSKVAALGSSSYSVASGRTAVVKVPISKAGRSALRRVRRPRIKVSATLTGASGSTSRLVAAKMTGKKKKSRKRGRR
jgi:hypothetical protein